MGQRFPPERISWTKNNREVVQVKQITGKWLQGQKEPGLSGTGKATVSYTALKDPQASHSPLVLHKLGLLDQDPFVLMPLIF